MSGESCPTFLPIVLSIAFGDSKNSHKMGFVTGLLCHGGQIGYAIVDFPGLQLKIREQYLELSWQCPPENTGEFINLAKARAGPEKSILRKI